MNIESLIEKIIPPSDYTNRNGFDNHGLIDELNQIEKGLLENELLQKLDNNPDDTLIAETLAYLKSEKSIPKLYELLNLNSLEDSKLIIATCIYEINRDSKMIDYAISSFDSIEKTNYAYTIYRLIAAFYYLAKYNSKRLNLVLERYCNNENHLLSYNAKQALNYR